MPAHRPIREEDCERGGASRLWSRKKYKIPGCRINIHNVAKRHLSEPSIWLTKETNLPIRWSSGRRVEATRSVDIYVWASYWCAVLSRLEYLGEGSCPVQKRTFASIVSDFSCFPQPIIISMISPWSQTLLALSFNAVMTSFWLLANLLSLYAKDIK